MVSFQSPAKILAGKDGKREAAKDEKEGGDAQDSMRFTHDMRIKNRSRGSTVQGGISSLQDER
jgi:hypothetical protein